MREIPDVIKTVSQRKARAIPRSKLQTEKAGVTDLAGYCDDDSLKKVILYDGQVKPGAAGAAFSLGRKFR
jgi:hypothetical protein